MIRRESNNWYSAEVADKHFDHDFKSKDDNCNKILDTGAIYHIRNSINWILSYNVVTPISVGLPNNNII